MRVSFAKWEPVGSIDDGPRTHLNKALVMHTAVSGATDLHDFWAGGSAGHGVGAHFYVNEQGTLYQYLDTDRQTGHAYAANAFSVGCETWDNGKPATTPWNAYQLATIVKLAQALGIPAQLLKETPSDGIGWHCQWPSWNLSNHSCPDDLRVAQVSNFVIPVLQTGGTMAAVDDVAAACGMTVTEFVESVRGGRAVAMKGLKEEGPPGMATAAEAFTYLTGLEGGSVTPSGYVLHDHSDASGGTPRS